MKNTFPYYLALVILIFASCGKEEADALVIPDTFTKKVIVEKYTGEWCGSCASSGRVCKDNKLSSQFIGVGIHAGDQHDRYKDAQACKDMYLQLYRELGEPGVRNVDFPNVIFDRTAKSNGKILNAYGSNEWQNRLDELVSGPTTCGLSISSTIKGDSLSGTISYVLKEALMNNPAITVYLVENNLDGSEQVGAISSYTHDSVLRELMTGKRGDSIEGTITDQILELDFETVDISKYKVADLEVIAFIHEMGADRLNKKVLNGQKAIAGTTKVFD